MRAAMCVVVRDLIVYGVLSDMMRGRPAVYATFSSYDEVAHHSGLERADTLEALRKLDQQFGRIDRARRYAPRPYEIVVLSDHGQTQGATFKQRNGYSLEEFVQRSGEFGELAAGRAATSRTRWSAWPSARRPAADAAKKRPKNDVSDKHLVVLGSGNLGLVYLMEEPRRLTMEEIEERHPALLSALREHPHIGWLLVRSSQHGALALGANGTRYLAEDRVEGEDPLAAFSPTAGQHLLRTDGFPHVADIMIGSFYNPELDEGCAFEELISFHGGLGGPQTRPFILYPDRLSAAGGTACRRGKRARPPGTLARRAQRRTCAHLGERLLEQLAAAGVAVGRQRELDRQLEKRREPGAVGLARLVSEPLVGHRPARKRVAEHERPMLRKPHDPLVGVEARPRLDLRVGGSEPRRATPVPRTRERNLHLPAGHELLRRRHRIDQDDRVVTLDRVGANDRLLTPLRVRRCPGPEPGLELAYANVHWSTSVTGR